MKTVIVAVALFFFSNSVGRAEEGYKLELGSPAELTGLRKVYLKIDTGDIVTDLKTKDLFTQILTEKLPELTITDRIDEASISLAFQARTSTFFAGSETRANVNTKGKSEIDGYKTKTTATQNTEAVYRTVTHAKGYVIKFMPDKKAKLLLEFEDEYNESAPIFERPPIKNFAREFIKAYKKANRR